MLKRRNLILSVEIEKIIEKEKFLNLKKVPLNFNLYYKW